MAIKHHTECERCWNRKLRHHEPMYPCRDNILHKFCTESKSKNPDLKMCHSTWSKAFSTVKFKFLFGFPNFEMFINDLCLFLPIFRLESLS